LSIKRFSKQTDGATVASPEQSDVMLVAIEDFIRGRFGPASMTRKVAWWLRVAASASAKLNRQKLDSLRLAIS